MASMGLGFDSPLYEPAIGEMSPFDPAVRADARTPATESQHAVLEPAEPRSSEVAFLSSLALQTQRAMLKPEFTGRDLVTAIAAVIDQSGRAGNGAESIVPLRFISLQVARSLKSQLWVWSSGTTHEDVPIEDNDLQSFRLVDHPARDSAFQSDVDEIPTGVVTGLTSCYSPLCAQEGVNAASRCYSPQCPRASALQSGRDGGAVVLDIDGSSRTEAWAETIPPSVLASLSKKEIARQNEIHEAIQKESEFLADLLLLETFFLPGLQLPSAAGDPP